MNFVADRGPPSNQPAACGGVDRLARLLAACWPIVSGLRAGTFAHSDPPDERRQPPSELRDDVQDSDGSGVPNVGAPVCIDIDGRRIRLDGRTRRTSCTNAMPASASASSGRDAGSRDRRHRPGEDEGVMMVADCPPHCAARASLRPIRAATTLMRLVITVRSPRSPPPIRPAPRLSAAQVPAVPAMNGLSLQRMRVHHVRCAC